MNQPMWDWSKEDDDVVAVIENGCFPDVLIKNSNGSLMLRDRNLPLTWFESSRDINYYKSIHNGRLHIRPEPEQPEWDWSKEDSDVMAVVAFSDAPDTLLKNQEGNTVLRKGRGEAEWEDLGDSLEWYKERFSSRLHIRPEPAKSGLEEFIDIARKDCAPSMMTKKQADAVEQLLFNMFEAGYIKEPKK